LSLDRAFRLTGLVGVAFFFAAAFTPLALALHLWMAVEPQLVPSDAIVVLGASVLHSGILSVESTRRTNHAIELYQQGLAPRLILLGGAPEGGPTEAEIRAKVARLHSIPAEAIVTESKARTTREEAARVADLARPRGIRTVLLVTNTAHMVRARPLFERAGFEVHAAPSDIYFEPITPEARLVLMKRLLQEVLGWIYYRIAGYA
jgi:uncharacterized SAM-binding protein YcdF (DUF218 family)